MDLLSFSHQCCQAKCGRRGARSANALSPHQDTWTLNVRSNGDKCDLSEPEATVAVHGIFQTASSAIGGASGPLMSHEREREPANPVSERTCMVFDGRITSASDRERLIEHMHMIYMLHIPCWRSVSKIKAFSANES